MDIQTPAAIILWFIVGLIALFILWLVAVVVLQVASHFYVKAWAKRRYDKGEKP
jgi:hypothetical protein